MGVLGTVRGWMGAALRVMGAATNGREMAGWDACDCHAASDDEIAMRLSHIVGPGVSPRALDACIKAYRVTWDDVASPRHG